MISIMLVDDSATIRGLLSRFFESCDGLSVIAKAYNGRMAIDEARKHLPDIIILDIEMPEMDGIEALPHILEASPNSIVLMASTLTFRNAEISLKAMQLGASDYLSKPSSMNSQELEGFYSDLKEKIFALHKMSNKTAHNNARSIEKPKSLPEKNAESAFELYKPNGPVKNAGALAIASSTGGPQALTQFFRNIDDDIRSLPIFITQHMPPVFTKALADQIKQVSGMNCSEAEDGEEVVAGKIYVAPGDLHMEVVKHGNHKKIKLSDSEPVHFCRPAADPMLRSLSDSYLGSLVSLVLTGMGRDGLDGCEHAIKNNGIVVAQDKESSVVWGMPGEVAKANLCRAVLPLDQIPDYISNLIKIGRNDAAIRL